ncbi:MAG: hypothetical protein M3Z04_18290, partial [Chloroflexota bacterium]|nr:hypothetical protein [Chloroflexota bacterium]
GVGGALAWAMRRRRSRVPLPAAQGWTLAVYALTVLAALGSYLGYTWTTDGSLQGRYTFVALVPFAVIGVGGVLLGPQSRRARRLGASAGGLALVVLQVVAWWRIGQGG